VESQAGWPVLLATWLQRIDGITADVATVPARIDAQLSELADAVSGLDAIPAQGR
jgi:hypothetical protein